MKTLIMLAFAIISWNDPIDRIDGTPLVQDEISSFLLACYSSSEISVVYRKVDNSPDFFQKGLILGLTPGIWYCWAYTIDTLDNISDPSAILTIECLTSRCFNK